MTNAAMVEVGYAGSIPGSESPMTKDDAEVGCSASYDSNNVRDAEFPTTESASAAETPKDACEHVGDKFTFPPDVFSMLFFAEWKSKAFVFGISVFCFQMLILGLLGFDLLSDESGRDNNSFNAPVQVDIQVAIAQVVALFIAIISQEQVTTTLSLASVDYPRSLKERFPEATYAKYCVSNFLRFAEGFIVTFVSFTLIVQADNVLDIFLNFAAIEFVAGLANFFYVAARDGWVGSRMKRLTAAIEEIELPERREKWIRDYAKPVSVVLLTVCLFSGWVGVRRNQKNGTLLKNTSCGTLVVNFGDEVYPFYTWPNYFAKFEVTSTTDVNGRVTKVKGSRRPLGPTFNSSNPPDLHYAYFSGLYEASFTERRNDRPIYYEQGQEALGKDVTAGMFYYCEKENAWVFSIEALGTAGAIPKETMQHRCKFGWLMRSPITEAFRLEDVPTDGWRIWTGAIEFASDFSVTCAECTSDLDCGLSNGKCHSDSKCACNTGFEGTFCNAEKPCDQLELVSDDPNATSLVFSILLGANGAVLKSYGKSVYALDAYRNDISGDISYENATELTSVVAVLGFAGRRWYGGDFMVEDIATRSGHAYWDNVFSDNIRWYSEVTDSHIPTGEQKWFRIGDTKSIGNYGPFGYSRESPRRFECQSVDCAVTNVCGLKGNCIENQPLSNTNLYGSKCACEKQYFGHFCEFEYAPTTTPTTAPTTTDDSML